MLLCVYSIKKMKQIQGQVQEYITSNRPEFQPDMNMRRPCSAGLRQKSLQCHSVGGMKEGEEENSAVET